MINALRRLFKHPPQLPDAERGERLLARAFLEGGEVLVSDRALIVRRETVERWSWPSLAAATWDDDAETLTVVPMRQGRDVILALPDPGRVPEAVRERLTASIVVSAHTPLQGAAGVRILGRRTAEGGDLIWQLRFDKGVDPSNPDVRQRAEDALADVKAHTVS